MMQVTQSTIGLVDRNLYSDENVFTVAYRKFMRDLALSLTNVTSTIDDDVTAIFEFEKMLARVNLSSHSYSVLLLSFSIIRREANKWLIQVTLFAQQLKISHVQSTPA